MDTSSELLRRRAAERVLPLIDLTSLGTDDTADQIEALCRDATTPCGPVAAVCVWPRFIKLASNQLEGTGLAIAGVANFPDGADDVDRAATDACEVVDNGGTEVDVVYPWKLLLADGHASDSGLVQQVRDAMPADVVLKVILETGELADPDIIRIAALDAIDQGADFLKTSTGKTDHSATPEAVRQLCEIATAADRPVGVKVSGGVRTVDDAQQYLQIADDVLGADSVGPNSFRIGASSLLADVLSVLRG